MDQNIPSSQSVQNVNQTPQPAQNQAVDSQKKIPKKKFLIIGIIIMLFFIIGVSVLFVLNKKTPNADNAPKTTTSNFPYQAVEKNGSLNEAVIKEMAQEISKYVLSQRRSDGYYNYLAHYEKQCAEKNGEKICPLNGVNMFQTTNAWTALAFFSASQILENPSLLTQAKEDLNKLEEYCALDRAQCNWVLAQPAIIYQTTQDPELLEFLRVQGETLLSSTPSDDVMLVAIEARELALLYEIFQDTRYIVAAQNRLLLASQSLDKERDLYPSKTLKFAESSCWVSLGNAQLAISTQNDQEKNNTKVFLENGKISQNFSYFYQPITIQPCIDGYAKISLSNEAKSILMQFIEAFYDGSKRKLIYGEGGTIFQPNSSNTNISLTDSSYTLYLLHAVTNL